MSSYEGAVIKIHNLEVARTLEKLAQIRRLAVLLETLFGGATVGKMKVP